MRVVRELPPEMGTRRAGAGEHQGVDAAVQQGWERFIGEDGAFVGMTGFGASAPAEVLYEKFGITTDAVVAAVKGRL